MKYLPHSALSVLAAAILMTGCSGNAGYDLTKYHDIYRIHYKYKPQPQPAADNLPPPTSLPAPVTPAPAAPPAQ